MSDKIKPQTPVETKKPARRPRSRTTRNLYERKPAKLVRLVDPVLAEAIGQAEQKGCWLIYGPEKNGKTTLALRLAQMLAKSEKVAYISAEEGLDKSFTDACRRAGVVVEDRIAWEEYMAVDDMIDLYNRPRSPRIIFIDNLTVYQDEMKPSELKKRLVDALPGKLFVLLAHEERGLPYPALGRMASKMAKVIFRVEGLRSSIVSRYGPGGEITIDPERAELFWGTNE